MSHNHSEADLAQYRRNLAQHGGLAACGACGRAFDEEPPKRSKYRAKAMRRGVVTFASTREYDRWAELERLLQAGKIAWYARQPRFPLDHACSGEYVADFVVAYMNGAVTVEDVKGVRLHTYKRAVRLLEGRMRLEVIES